MWTSHAVALTGLVLLLLAWLGVQSAWRRVFRADDPEADALARGGCGALRCATPCTAPAGRAAGEGGCPHQEEAP